MDGQQLRELAKLQYKLMVDMINDINIKIEAGLPLIEAAAYQGITNTLECDKDWLVIEYDLKDWIMDTYNIKEDTDNILV